MVCSKCNDTGWYQYDHNHSTVCNQCCKHNQGWWLLRLHYGKDNNKWCCLGGCGKTLTYKELIQRLTKENTKLEPICIKIGNNS